MLRYYLSDLRQIWRSDEIYNGIERFFDLIIFCLKPFVISELILLVSSFFHWWPDRYRVTEWCVVGTTALLSILLYYSHCAPLFSALFASYFLVGTIVLMANIVFLTKIFGPLKSNERTLLLFILNVVQLILTFAVWYRSELGLQANKAFFKAMLVFGTIGYPKGANFVVGSQIAADFFLLAIFLVFVLNFKRQGRR